MKLRKDHKGFSLVELVIVVGIVAIIASMSLIIINRLRYANTEKVVKNITNGITKLQMKTMSKEQKPYLYIYMVGSDYYMIMSTDGSGYDPTSMGTNGTKLGAGFTISYNMGPGNADHVIDGSNFIRLGYKRDGSFMGESDHVPKEIIVATPIKTIKIKLNREIGKFVVE